METKKPIQGSCLCGSIKFESTATPSTFLYCTCRSCQKTTGSAHATNLMVPVASLVWTEGESLIRKYVEQNENPGFPTWFCSQCGSFLPHISRSGEDYVIPAGLLDVEIETSPQAVIYWEECPSWYRSTDSLAKHATDPE